LAEREAHELAALVGVMDQSGLGPALVDGHLQRVDDELSPHVLGQLPAGDPARIEILHRSEIAAALPGLQIGDVRAPQRVRRRRPKAALHEIVGDPHARNADRRPAPPATDQPRDLRLTHQPLDPLLRDVDATTETPIELVLLDPVPQRLLGDPKALRDVLDAAPRAHQPDRVAAELLGIRRPRSRHAEHPSCRA